MRILTWNIHGAYLYDRDERFPRIKKAIEEIQPDIACIQEAFFPKSRNMLESISGYHPSYQTNFFPPRTTKGGLFTLTKAKPQEVSFHPYQMQGSWRSEQKWDRLISKGFLETTIEDPEFGKVAIINTHKVCTYSPEPDHYLEDQVHQLVGHLEQERDGLVIVAGDFNFERKTHLYQKVRTRLHDATASLGNFHLFDYQPIDYIFLNQEHQHTSQYVIVEWEDTYPSDHPGIFADIHPNCSISEYGYTDMHPHR